MPMHVDTNFQAGCCWRRQGRCSLFESITVRLTAMIMIICDGMAAAGGHGHRRRQLHNFRHSAILRTLLARCLPVAQWLHRQPRFRCWLLGH